MLCLLIVHDSNTFQAAAIGREEAATGVFFKRDGRVLNHVRDFFIPGTDISGNRIGDGEAVKAHGKHGPPNGGNAPAPGSDG